MADATTTDTHVRGASALAVALAAVGGAAVGARVVAATGGRVVVPALVIAVVLRLHAHRSTSPGTARDRARLASVVVLVATAAFLRAGAEWRDVSDVEFGPWRGWATVESDPAPRGSAMVVVVRLDEKRFETWAYGRHRSSAGSLEAGDLVWLAGTTSAIGDATARRRSAVRHVVGRVRLEFIADIRDGSPGAVAANRVRGMLRSSAERSMDARHAALFTGLVIGDDARQDPSMVEEFRDAGLSHLTAVSGQNVAFVLLAAGPLLRRLSPWARWSSTLALIAGFAAVARGEPSVLRAGVMAALSATAFTVGRPVSPLRLLGLAVSGLVLVDPFLVHSVGFWLSVGATAGVCALAPVIERRLPGPSWLTMPLSLTIAAQAGVAIPALVVFGRLPAVALLANPAASAVAGFVMLAGIPSATASAMASELGAPSIGDALMWPVAVGTRWVADVAGVAAALPLPAASSIAAWTALAAWLALRRPRTPVPF